MGVHRGGAKWAFTPRWKLRWRTKISRKPKVSSIILTNWFKSSNYSLFAGMTLTLHKSQVHCSGVMQWWACSSLIHCFFACRGRLPNLRADCSTVDLHWVTNTAKILTSASAPVAVADVLPHVTVERKHLATLADNAARHWLPIVVSHVGLYCVKRSMNESVAMLHKFEKSIVSVRMNPCPVYVWWAFTVKKSDLTERMIDRRTWY